MNNRDALIIPVDRPARYTGGEAGSVVKDPESVRLSLALAFPEIYEIGMSHLGLKILYDALAPRPEVAAERVFCPWLDLMDEMTRQGAAPWSLETGRALGEFDVIGFSLLYELTYTNMLHMLRLAGVPALRSRRGPEHPLVIAGGPCTVNPEPVADFLDLVAVGEGEELIHELCDLFIAAKEAGWDRDTLYRRAAEIEGVYAPALFEPRGGPRPAGVRPLDPQRPTVRRRLVADMGDFPPPDTQVVPLVRPVHDRLGVEIARGCTRGCRFCQAGFIYRPVRERPADQVLEASLKGLARSGYEELALLSLSAGDYSCIEPLASGLMDVLEARRWSLSLPSLRVDSLSRELAGQIKRVRKSGFTLAPEAGSQRLRDIINKNLSEEQILAVAARVFGLGWNHIKLYFMLGLPGETDEDVEAIGELCAKVVDTARAAGKGRGKKPVVHASLGLFVPKSHTPFQWEGQMDLAEARRRLNLAREACARPGVKVRWTEPEQSVLEGVLARGNRRLSRALLLAAEAGCRFDGWGDILDYQTWLGALKAAGLKPDEFLRPRDEDETLPWAHIDTRVEPEYLLAERRRAGLGESTGDCRDGRCFQCGACDHKMIKPILHPEPPAPAPPPPVSPEERTTYRFRLEKTGPARFLGHLEMISQVVRAFQRAGVDLAFTQGFHPHPLVKTNSALPLGVESLVESLAVTVHGHPAPQELQAAVNPELPAGLAIADGRPARPGEGLDEPDVVTYLVRSPSPLSADAIGRFDRAEELIHLRSTPKGERPIDLKNTVRGLRFTEQGLEAVVGRRGGRPKPAEILQSVFGLSRREALAARALKIGARMEEN